MVADATVESANAAGANATPPKVVTAANAAAAPMRRVSLLFCFMFTSLLLPAPKRLDQVDVVVLSAPEGAAAGVCVLWFAGDWSYPGGGVLRPDGVPVCVSGVVLVVEAGSVAPEVLR